MSRRSDILKSTIGCSPTLYLNTLHQLSSEQILFLNRGPSYVSPCQVHLMSSPNLPLEKILSQQLAPLQQQLTKLFIKYPIVKSRQVQFEERVKKLFYNSFILPIPNTLKERGLYEQKLIQSIRNQLKQNQLILRRTADNNNTYYLGQSNDFRFKSNEFIHTSESFECLGFIDDQNTLEQHLNRITQSMDTILNDLFKQKSISEDHLSKLSMSQRTNIKLPYLYFLPEINEDNSILLEPKLSCCKNAPVQILATYLEQILQPLYEQVVQSILFHNGTDFMKKLQSHCCYKTVFKSTTSFITFEIHHLYSNVSHEDLRLSIKRLLTDPIIRQPDYNGLSADVIEILVNMFLQTNIFIYNDKIYRYIKGCPLNFSFSRLLFNIYLYHWYFTWFRSIRIENECFGLFKNTGFFTWNQSIDKIEKVFNEINQTYNSPIHITTSIGLQVHYLNCYIENRDGSLYSRVYYNPNKQRFLLPYFDDHPRLRHRQWFRFLLVRAGLYCTKIEDFEYEKLYIELTFIANGYSLNFVEYHIRQFFKLIYPSNTTTTEFDQYRYNVFRHDLSRYVTQQQELQKNHRFIQLDYIFDWGSRWKFNSQFYTNWITILEQDPKFKKYKLKIKLNSKHYFLSNTLFTQ